VPIPENAQAIWNFLIAQGFTSNAAAGIEGNIEQESGGDPTAGTNPPGAGLIQILGDPGGSLSSELAKTMQYIKANGSVSDINANSPNPASSALYFSTKYERPDPALANNQNREASAVEVANAAASGNWPVGTASTPSSASTTSASGIPNPFGITSDIFGNIGSDIFTGLTNGILKALGLPSLKDLFERAALIVLGFVLLIIGIHLMSGGTGSSQPINITTNETADSTTTTRRVNAGPVKHTKTTKVAKEGKGVGAGEAMEAAAVA
jgi:Phage tail lysozyme